MWIILNSVDLEKKGLCITSVLDIEIKNETTSSKVYQKSNIIFQR